MMLNGLEEEKGHLLMLCKLMRFFGIHWLMAIVQGWATREFWDKSSNHTKYRMKGLVPTISMSK
jgi:hypothetical protein